MGGKHKSNEQLRLVKFLPAIIFVLVSIACIMGGWLIGGLYGGFLGLILGGFLSFAGFGLIIGWIWRKRYSNLKHIYLVLLVLGWFVIPGCVPLVFPLLLAMLQGTNLDSLAAIFLLCATPLSLIFLGALGGLVGGIMSGMVLRAVDPDVSKKFHARIIIRSMLGFFVGFLVGGIPIGMGFSSALFLPTQYLSYQQALYVAIGFALMGIIGVTIAGSALYREEIR